MKSHGLSTWATSGSQVWLFPDLPRISETESDPITCKYLERATLEISPVLSYRSFCILIGHLKRRPSESCQKCRKGAQN